MIFTTESQVRFLSNRIDSSGTYALLKSHAFLDLVAMDHSPVPTVWASEWTSNTQPAMQTRSGTYELLDGYLKIRVGDNVLYGSLGPTGASPYITLYFNSQPILFKFSKWN